jgi:Flp pilus assembly protein TadB
MFAYSFDAALPTYNKFDLSLSSVFSTCMHPSIERERERKRDKEKERGERGDKRPTVKRQASKQASMSRAKSSTRQQSGHRGRREASVLVSCLREGVTWHQCGVGMG